MPKLYTTEDYDRCLKWYGRKKPRELAAVLRNLDILVRSMADGKPIKPFLYGFLAAELDGVVRVAQGGNAGMAETRLYVYHEVATDSLCLLIIGDKRSQSDDIQYCSRVARGLAARPVAGDDEDESQPTEDEDDDDNGRDQAGGQPGDAIGED